MTMSDETQKTLTLYILEHAYDTLFDAEMKGPCKNKEFMDALHAAFEDLKKARLALLEVKQ